MSIDEAIAQEREVAEIHRNDIVPKEDYHNMPWIDKENELNMRSAEEHEQFAEWLEELKAYREIGTVEECRNSVLDIPKAYNKAIDEAICKVEEHKTKGYVTGITNNPFEFGACQMADDIVKILEQLKVGGENDNLRI